MFGTHHVAVFVASGILLNLTPGQDTLYILGRSIAQGRRAGVLSALGIATGTVVHTLAAALGLSAILATSANAFTIVRLTGAAYLVYLGVRMLMDRTPAGAVAGPAPVQTSGWGIYRAGILTNVLNPKVALFFLAFLPQFVSPAAASTVVPFLFLGSLFIGTGTAWCLVLVWCASAMSRRFREQPSAGILLRRASGMVFIGLGARLAANR